MGKVTEFKKAVSPIFGGTFIDYSHNVLSVGDLAIPLDPCEMAVVNSLMCAAVRGKSVKMFDLKQETEIKEVSLFDLSYKKLVEKLSKYPIANYGGNGSYYEDTIYASDFIRHGKNGRLFFYKELAETIFKNPIPTDEQLWDIQYQPRDYKPMVCCL